MIRFDDASDLTALEQVEAVKATLISRATGLDADDGWYRDLRMELIQNAEVRDRLPSFIRTCRSLEEFWSLIKAESDTYEGRRVFIREAFDPLLTHLEEVALSPARALRDSIPSEWTPAAVDAVWQKMLARLATDPEGAITAARTLLETVCKTICEDLDICLGDHPELAELYRETAKALNLAPEQHQERVFKQILGGCSGIVGGLAGLRNSLGDAHGRSTRAARPAPRHAQLAVNLAGSMSAFLIATWRARAMSTFSSSRN